MAVSDRAYQKILRARLTHRPKNGHRGLRRGTSTVAVFVTDDAGVIWALDATGAVVGSITDCAGAEGAKVDAYGNLWVACTNTSTINMYDPGSPTASLTLNDTIAGVPYYVADVAVDGVGNVYATSLYAYACPSSSCTFVPGQISYWSAANVTNGATPSGSVNEPDINTEAYFLDTDPIGNVYVDYYSCAASLCGNGLDQIINPQSATPTVNTLVSTGSGQLAYPGGVYTSNFQTQLNVLDQGTKQITEYPIVVQSVGGPSGSLGPAASGTGCDPVAMGWDQTDSQIAIGDAGCQAVDFGMVSANTWTQDVDGEFANPIGAAYVASDKDQPQFIGQDHTLIMQALIENFSQVSAIAGPNPSGMDVLQAMLHVSQVPQATKNVISEVLLVPQVPLDSVCQAASSQFENNFPTAGSYQQILGYLKKEASIQSPCLRFHSAVEGALAIALAGKSTIYNSKWIKASFDKGYLRNGRVQPDRNKCWRKWRQFLAADVTGSILGLGAGPWGVLGAAALSSAAWALLNC